MNESDETRLRAVWRQLPQPEPDPALDRAILGRARQAMDQSRRPGFHLRWGFGAVAASILCLAMLLPVRQAQFAPAPEAASVDSSAAGTARPEIAEPDARSDVGKSESLSNWANAPAAPSDMPAEAPAAGAADPSLGASPPLAIDHTAVGQALPARAPAPEPPPAPPPPASPAPVASSAAAAAPPLGRLSEEEAMPRSVAKPAPKQEQPLLDQPGRRSASTAELDDVQDQIEALLNAGARAQAIGMLSDLLRSNPDIQLRASLQPLKAEALAEPVE